MNLDREKYLGKDNTTFCMLPWVHSYIHTDGNVKLCCISNPSMGKLDANNSWETIWNSDEYKKIRRLMLGNVPINPYCYQCYRIDSLDPENPVSLRAGMNRQFGRYFDEIVTKTNPDGSLDSMDIKYIDIRWNNVCNLKCRMCGPSFSSLIAAENLQLEKHSRLDQDKIVISVTDHRPNFLDEILPHVDGIDSIYFAGGEPLVTKEHYQILDYMISRGLTDVAINYNTNFSKLKYDGWDVIELWKQFKHVSVRPSLDSWGVRAEYLRSGTKWPQVEQNIDRMLTECPHIDFRISTVVSSFNCLTLAEFLDYMINRFGLKETMDFNPFVLDYPRPMNVDVLPVELRQQALNSINQLLDRYPSYANLRRSLDIVVGALTREPAETTEEENIKGFIDKYDQRRNTVFTETFPELTDWYNSL